MKKIYYIVPNWNLRFKPICFDSLESLFSYAENNNLMLTESFDKPLLIKIHKLLNPSDIKKIFVGW